MRNCFCSVVWALGVLLLSGGLHLVQAREPRVIFNDDAQMLMEAPRDGATKFVKAWLDREIEAVPFSTYVFLAATPDICTYASKAGETYGDRFNPPQILMDMAENGETF